MGFLCLPVCLGVLMLFVFPLLVLYLLVGFGCCFAWLFCLLK